MPDDRTLAEARQWAREALAEIRAEFWRTQGVRAAEQMVARQWVAYLQGRCQLAADQRTQAQQDCALARRLLTLAEQDGDLAQIAAQRAQLDQSLQTEHRARRRYREVLVVVNRELHRVNRALVAGNRQQMDQLGQVRTAMDATLAPAIDLLLSTAPTDGP
ncbi:hypothetical protein [Actinomadura kijaniata]|uniref:hypothetical protein n=1 Tax=Actinomadura kijaniata TaxID=46161 RepID=UPI00082E7044|nr:hypothetical protein [Actinomadura kijaniata]